MSRFKLLPILLAGMIWAQSDFIFFPHPLHVDDEEIECEACHEGVEFSSSLDTRYLPEKDVCSDCHDVDDEDECEMCHADSEDPLGYSDFQPTSGLSFSHDYHINSYSDNCFACHDYFDVEDMESAPTAWKDSDCRTCHVSNKPADHYAGWIPIHGMELLSLSMSDNNCSVCHTESSCNDCHVNQQVEPRNHANNYMLNHGFDARIGVTDCGSCHDMIIDCYTCHNQHDAMPLDHSLPNWSGAQLVDGGEHGQSAMDTPMVCKSCHIQENEATCMRCHS